MSVIQNFLTKILEARYGEEVRGSIHDAIDQCYKDATGHPESVAAVVEQNDQMADLLKNTPYTTAIEDTNEFELPVHTIRDDVTTDTSTWSSQKIQDALDNAQNDINNVSQKITDKFIIIDGVHNGLEGLSDVDKTITIGSVAELGGKNNLQVIFAGQDHRTHYASPSDPVEYDFTGVYRPIINVGMYGMDSDTPRGQISPYPSAMRETGGNIVLDFNLRTDHVPEDQNVYYDIKYRFVIMLLS